MTKTVKTKQTSMLILMTYQTEIYNEFKDDLQEQLQYPHCLDLQKKNILFAWTSRYKLVIPARTYKIETLPVHHNYQQNTL